MSKQASIKKIKISKPHKTFFPDAQITKEDVAEYYAKIADTVLPYIKDRPLTMERYPDGIDGERFYQKHAQDYFPDAVRRVTLKNRQEEGSTEYVLCQNAQTLVYLAQLGCITPHYWLSRKDQPDTPDRMVFDLDPASAEDFDTVVQAANILKKLLEEDGLTPFVMTTGSKGMHVLVPIKRELGFDTVRDYARAIAEQAMDQAPDMLTMEVRKEKRKGKLFLDTARNAYGQTAVMPYALRARERAPVATPLTWDEVGQQELRADTYTIKNIFQRLAQKSDPWADISHHASSLPA